MYQNSCLGMLWSKDSKTGNKLTVIAKVSQTASLKSTMPRFLAHRRCAHMLNKGHLTNGGQSVVVVVMWRLSYCHILSSALIVHNLLLLLLNQVLSISTSCTFLLTMLCNCCTPTHAYTSAAPTMAKVRCMCLEVFYSKVQSMLNSIACITRWRQG